MELLNTLVDDSDPDVSVPSPFSVIVPRIFARVGKMTTGHGPDRYAGGTRGVSVPP